MEMKKIRISSWFNFMLQRLSESPKYMQHFSGKLFEFIYLMLMNITGSGSGRDFKHYW